MFFVAVLLAITLPAFSREVKTDYDHHANFSQYKTYSWGKIETPNPLWDDRIKEAVNNELAKKGWTEVPSDGDVTIMGVGTSHERPILRTFYDGFPGWRWGGFGEATTYVDNDEVGSLICRDPLTLWPVCRVRCRLLILAKSVSCFCYRTCRRPGGEDV